MSPIPVPDEPCALGSADLVCHPDTPCRVVRRIQCCARLLGADLLSLTFTVTGTIDELIIPQAAPPARTDRLWEHTCFEAFLAAPGTEGYLELNLSPSAAWAAYAFQRYREGMRPAEVPAPSILVHRSPERLEVQALLRLREHLAGKPLSLGLSAVIEERNGALSCWTLHHPQGRPDFHHPEGFVLKLAPMPGED